MMVFSIARITRVVEVEFADSLPGEAVNIWPAGEG